MRPQRCVSAWRNGKLKVTRRCKLHSPSKTIKRWSKGIMATRLYTMLLAVVCAASVGCCGGLGQCPLIGGCGGGCASCGLADASCGCPDASCGCPEASCSCPDASCGCPDASCGLPESCDSCSTSVGCGSPVIGQCRLLQRIRNALTGCSDCSSDVYRGDWHTNPSCDCDACSSGSSSTAGQYRHPRPYAGSELYDAMQLAKEGSETTYH